MATRMQQRRGTAEQWTLIDPVLAEGEIGFESDTGNFKIGNGVDFWFDLPYFENSESLGGSLDDYIPLTQKNTANGVATLDGTGNVPLSQLGNVPETDLSAYATTQYVDDEIAAIPAPDFTGYATETFVTNAIDAIPDVDLTGYATETYVNTAVSNLVDSAPAALDTLNELAAALGDDENFATTITNAIAGKANTVHTHAISDVTSLQTELDARKIENVYEISANTTLAANSRYFVDTATALTLTLPATPAVNDEIWIIDQSNLAATNNITVNNNGSLINGVSDTLVIDANGAVATLLYTGATLGWRI